MGLPRFWHGISWDSGSSEISGFFKTEIVKNAVFLIIWKSKIEIPGYHILGSGVFRDPGISYPGILGLLGSWDIRSWDLGASGSWDIISQDLGIARIGVVHGARR